MVREGEVERVSNEVTESRVKVREQFLGNDGGKRYGFLVFSSVL